MVDLCENNVISIITCQLNKPIDKPKEIYEILSSKPLKELLARQVVKFASI